MNFDVSKIVKAEGASLKVSVEIDIESIDFGGQVFQFVSPFKVDGTVKNAVGNLYLEADAKAQFKTNCARCLKEITQTLDFEIDESFAQGELDENSVFLPIVSNTIDLKKVVEDNFCTSVPFVFLCDDECSGLCPVCGHNLNDGACDCESDEIDPRLEGLKAFLKND